MLVWFGATFHIEISLKWTVVEAKSNFAREASLLIQLKACKMFTENIDKFQKLSAEHVLQVFLTAGVAIVH